MHTVIWQWLSSVPFSDIGNHVNTQVCRAEWVRHATAPSFSGRSDECWWEGDRFIARFEMGSASVDGPSTLNLGVAALEGSVAAPEPLACTPVTNSGVGTRGCVICDSLYGVCSNPAEQVYLEEPSRFGSF